jgi:hypothetical protein
MKFAKVGASLDLRRSRRYRVLGTGLFWWERADGHLQQNGGTIENISDRGVFLLSNALPPVGAHLEMDVSLQAAEIGASPIQFHGEGTVIRVEWGSERRKGFGASIAFTSSVGR